MEKKIVRWTEVHYYEAEIEVPDGLFPDEETDWLMNNPSSSWPGGNHYPYEINTDWDSIEIYQK